MTTTFRGPDVAATVMAALFHQEGRDRLTAREQRGIALASAFSLREGRRGEWFVSSQSSGREYRVRGGGCPCADDHCCKHLVAVDLLARYAHELLRRLDCSAEWDGTVAHAQSLHDDYLSLLCAAAGYAPPPEGLLCSFRLEAVGDDAWQQQRQARRAGVPYVPGRLRDLHPERPWVAALNGLSVRYEFERGFLRGKVDYREADKCGSRGVYLFFFLPPGLYEIYERLDHRSSRRYFAEVADLGLREISKKEVLACLARRPS